MEPPETGARPEPPAVRLAGEYLNLLEDGAAPPIDEFLAEAPSGDREECREIVDAALRTREVLAGFRSVGGPGPKGDEPPDIPGFRILEEIGRGGLGVVYAAWDEWLQWKGALKVLRWRTAPDVRERILAEARKAAGLKDPAIVTVHSVVETGECPAIVLEHIEGVPIDQLPDDLTFRQKARILQAIARALASAHRRGIIHRDLKPENVLVTPQLEPKVLDFGLAIRAEASGRAPGIFEGTPLYASPEQARGEAVTESSDVFSFGSLAFRFLAGRPPFWGGTVDEVLERIATEDPPFPRSLVRDIPDDLQAICLACLARDPRARPDADEVAADLARYLAGEPSRLRPSLYGDILRRRISEHVGELRTWCGQGMISPAEVDRLQVVYRRILEDEDHWIIDTRKLSVPQSALYTGTWMAIVAAVLFVWLAREDFSPAVRWIVPALGTALLLAVGVWAHVRREVPAAASFLAGAILSFVPAALSALAESEVLAMRPDGIGQLLGPPFSNGQILAASLGALGLSALSWRRLRLTAFAWTTAALAVGSYLAFLLTLGWLDRREEIKALWCLPLAALEAAALIAERVRRARWALPYHLVALIALAACLDVMAEGGYTFKLLGILRGSGGAADFLARRKEEYAFALNGLVFLGLMFATERARSLDLRRGSVLLELLALVHLLGPLYASALNRKGLLDAGIYLAVALALLLLGPWKNRRRFLLAGLLGIALGSHLLIDLKLVPRPAFIIALGALGLAGALAAFRYLARRDGAARKPRG